MTDVTNPAGDEEEFDLQEDLQGSGADEASEPLDSDQPEVDADPEDGPLESWDNIPEGTEPRSEEFADDDPADVPVADGGDMAGLDTDGDGILDTSVPEGTHLVDGDTF